MDKEERLCLDCSDDLMTKSVKTHQNANLKQVTFMQFILQ